MAGNPSKTFNARPGVNYLLHESQFLVSHEDMADLKRIAKTTAINSARDGKIGLQTNEKNFLTVLPKLSFEDGGLVDLTLMPVKLGFQTGSEALEGLPYFATGEEGKKIFLKYEKLSADLGTELVFENGYIKVKG